MAISYLSPSERLDQIEAIKEARIRAKNNLSSMRKQRIDNRTVILVKSIKK
ncbi:MAG TPA: hypothetical protein PKC47_07245 [Petrimonas sp.]|nr:hypothetical protein [Petrimonas sp.]